MERLPIILVFGFACCSPKIDKANSIDVDRNDNDSIKNILKEKRVKSDDLELLKLKMFIGSQKV